MVVDPNIVSRVKIFPPIGIARVGDSGFDLESGKPDLDTLEYFLPPEIPGRDSDTLQNGFKFREDRERRDYHLQRKVNEKLTRIQQEPEAVLEADETEFRARLHDESMSLDEIRIAFTNKHRVHHDRIKRQGVRFRVYAYNAAGLNIGEITANDGFKLTWTVHVANHKASYEVFRGMYKPRTGDLRNPGIQGDRQPEDRDRLIVDPGPKTISSPDINTIIDISGKFQGSRADTVDVHLGQLRTNEEGHLIFIGGAGYSRCVTSRDTPHPDIVSEFDSADWVDDMCDGWVEVLVGHDNPGFSIKSSPKATVLSAPPKFAWGVRSPTTWYDLIADIYAKRSDRRWRERDYTGDRGEKVEFYRDIWPTLHATYAVSWTNQEAFEGHGVASKGNVLAIEEKVRSNGQESKVFREAIFNRLRAPDYKALAHASTRYMPRFSGNDGDAIEPGENLRHGEDAPPIRRYAALTALQYERFSLWKEGNFLSDPVPWNGAAGFGNVPLRDQPACLTLAALDHTIGEPLYPGIEVYWIAKDPRTYVLEVDTDSLCIDPPFRINHKVMAPGYLTRGLSLPWQSDFDQCNTHWWPTIRPDDVINERDFPTPTAVKPAIPETEFINTILPQRKSWTRGIRISPSENAEYYPGSTDMVKYWSRLGFVVEDRDKKINRGGQQDPTWLEKEREKIVRKDKMTHLPEVF